MRRRSLRRAAAAYAITVVSVALLSGGLIGSTFALFTAETTNDNATFAGGWVDPPSGVAVGSLSGESVKVTWTPGTNGIASQQVNAVDNGSSSTCPSATSTSYTQVYNVNNSTKSNTTDSTAISLAASNSLDWFCYQVQSSNGSWTSATDGVAIQSGFFPTGMDITTNGNGKINKNDKITINYNQKPNLTSPIVVCTWVSGHVVIGDTNGACTASADSSYYGRLNISGGTIASSQAYETSTAAWNNSTNTLTITLKSASSPTANLSGTPTWTYVPDSGLVSNGDASLAVCTSSTCQPTTTDNF